MSIEASLRARSNNQCEVSGTHDDLVVYAVEPGDGSAEQSILISAPLKAQLDAPDSLNANDWRGLNEAIWSPTAAVQVVAYRMLHRLAAAGEGWAQDLLDTAYLEDEVKAWAEAGMSRHSDDDTPKPRDSNGVELSEGDSVTLIKDLDVKGAGFTAKRGTLVKNIHLTNDPKYIEGKVNGTAIVLVAAYLKKA